MSEFHLAYPITVDHAYVDSDTAAVDSVESLFSVPDSVYQDSIVKVPELPYLARPLIEELHEFQPDAVFAADRGGRPAGLAVMRGWHYHYPGEPFPTVNGCVNFNRISGQSVEFTAVRGMIRDTLNRMGALHYEDALPSVDAGFKVALIDDWTVNGRAFTRFERAVKRLGVHQDSIRFLTLIGDKLDDRHVVGDLSRKTRSATWMDRSHISGIDFGVDGITPIAVRTNEALNLRLELARETKKYYERFTAELGRLSLANTG